MRWALSWENTDDFCHIYNIYMYIYVYIYCAVILTIFRDGCHSTTVHELIFLILRNLYPQVRWLARYSGFNRWFYAFEGDVPPSKPPPQKKTPKTITSNSMISDDGGDQDIYRWKPIPTLIIFMHSTHNPVHLFTTKPKSTILYNPSCLSYICMWTEAR